MYEIQEGTSHPSWTSFRLGLRGITINEVVQYDDGKMYATGYSDRIRATPTITGYQHRQLEFEVTVLPDGNVQLLVVKYYWPRKLIFPNGFIPRVWSAWLGRELVSEPFNPQDTDVITLTARNKSTKAPVFQAELCEVEIMRHPGYANYENIPQQRVITP